MLSLSMSLSRNGAVRVEINKQSSVSTRKTSVKHMTPPHIFKVCVHYSLVPSYSSLPVLFLVMWPIPLLLSVPEVTHSSHSQPLTLFSMAKSLPLCSMGWRMVPRYQAGHKAHSLLLRAWIVTVITACPLLIPGRTQLSLSFHSYYGHQLALLYYLSGIWKLCIPTPLPLQANPSLGPSLNMHLS